ncbi:hypothetical protein [Neorickettsia sp. 179522]|uniref:hypothetical protein n=1 Tax=Neorickettsia sp. 179522 TaxID=1714371 RepID=UPI00079407DF|nr:hypothetical protein [Neorickettsia sp. 179522]KYH12276.1 hypothetical protein AS219_00380 [Neorickettsia sp. 179522]
MLLRSFTLRVWLAYSVSVVAIRPGDIGLSLTILLFSCKYWRLKMSAVGLCEPKYSLSMFFVAVLGFLSILVLFIMWIVSVRRVKAEIRTLKKRVEDFYGKLDLYLAMSPDMSFDQKASMRHANPLCQTHWMQNGHDVLRAVHDAAGAAEKIPFYEHMLVEQLKHGASLSNAVYGTVDAVKRIAAYERMLVKQLEREASLSDILYDIADPDEKIAIYERMLIRQLERKASLSDMLYDIADPDGKMSLHERMLARQLERKASLSLREVVS